MYAGKRSNKAVENQGFVLVVGAAIGVTIIAVFLLFQYLKRLKSVAEGIDMSPLPHACKWHGEQKVSNEYVYEVLSIYCIVQVKLVSSKLCLLRQYM